MAHDELEVNTGLSLRQTVDAVRGGGGMVAGAACLVSRGNVEAAGLGVDHFAFLLEYKVPSLAGPRVPALLGVAAILAR